MTLRFAIVAFALVAAQSTLAQPVVQSASVQQPPLPIASDVARIKERYPKTQFVSITPTPIPGVYQAIMANKRLAYIEASGRYFFFGRIFDMERTEDLTEPVLASLEGVDVSSIPTADAIKVVKGNGRRTLYVFSDPDCPFCRTLETTLAQLTDVTIYTFMYPIAQIHPQARAKSVAVWCAKDRAAAWEAATSGRPLPSTRTDCDHPVDRNVDLAKSLNITATPTMVSGDGRLLRGAVPADRIAAFLDQSKVVVSEATK